jgi:hypothetical protein
MVDDAKKSEELEGEDAGVEVSKAQSPKIKKELSVVSLPHDNDVMAQEMAELFDEDRVTHKHGGSEPEKD